jgi:3-methyl-2-oxobutanoate hydroxymethyltransferase
MLQVETLDEAAAAEQAGIDMVSVPPSLLQNAGFRSVAPTVFTCPGLDPGVYITEEECLRAAYQLIGAGADMVYCPQRPQTIRSLAEEGIPVCGHTGLVPQKQPGPVASKRLGKRWRPPGWSGSR